ncbi:hypothetical protein PQ459_05330 [Chryseobacterium sp. KACC 21268]|nr:hypothetical protein PQ459_05330 [Chryseobacterium sp. KACC 21268]
MIIIVAGYTYFFYQLYLESEAEITRWSISDWLINYEDGGFKRRGLSGSILFKIQDLTGVRLQFLVLMLQISSYIFFIFIIIRQLIKKTGKVFFISLLLSPFILLFPVCTYINSGRKEILLIILLYGYAFLPKSRLYDWLCFSGFILMIFFHELTFFYLPFFLWIQFKKYGKQTSLSTVFAEILIAILATGIIYFYGGNINQGESIQLLMNRGVTLGTSNIFTEEFAYDFNHILKYRLSYFVHLIEFSIILFQLYFYVLKFQRSLFREFLSWSLFSLVWVLPLFYLGIDWFRWIYIFSCFMVLMILIQSPDKMESEVDFNQRKNLWPLLITPFSLVLFYFHMNHDEILRLIGF